VGVKNILVLRWNQKAHCRFGGWPKSHVRAPVPSWSSLVPRPHLRERVWWHPADTSGFITFWREISLRQSHCRKDNL